MDNDNNNSICVCSARTSKTQCLCVIALIWIAGLALSSPMAYAQRVVFVSEDWPFCLNVNLSQNVMFVYRALLVVVQYVIPLSIMTWAYSGIGFALWGSSAPGNAQSQRDLNLMRNKKRVSHIFLSRTPLLWFLLLLCWYYNSRRLSHCVDKLLRLNIAEFFIHIICEYCSFILILYYYVYYTTLTS